MAKNNGNYICSPHYEQTRFFNLTGMPLYVELVGGQIDHRMHDHDFTELVVVAKGTGRHIAGKETFTLETGDVFVMHENEKHSYRNTRDLHLFNVIFDLEKLEIPVKELNRDHGFKALFTIEPKLRSQHGFKSRLRLSPATLAIISDILIKIRKEQEKQRALYKPLCASLLFQVICILSRAYSNIEDPGSRELLRLAPVLEHMESNFDRKIHLPDLAELACMSQSSFQRLFRRRLHASPIDYLLQIRIKKAAELLVKDKLLVKEAAAAAGFDDTNYFTRRFTILMGMSPARYRQTHITVDA